MNTAKQFGEYIARKEKEYGESFDPSDLAAQFIPYYENQSRIEVEFKHGDSSWTERGRVGVTTGWKPAFLLMKRASDRSSSTILHGNDKIVRVIQHGPPR